MYVGVHVVYVMYACMHVYVCVSVMCVWMYARMYACMFAMYVCLCAYVRWCVCVHGYVDVCTSMCVIAFYSFTEALVSSFMYV